MKKQLPIILLLCLTGLQSYAQHKCLSHELHKTYLEDNPKAIAHRASIEASTQEWISNNAKNKKAIITIPVVVHVVWNVAEQNISQEQVEDQIRILNEDFANTNSDRLTSDHPFFEFGADDTEIRFCLANTDENGNETLGITRTQTDSAQFAGMGNEKFGESGGKSGWDPERYMNLWVCDLGASGGTLGYATFPDELEFDPELDGIVCDYHAFGSIGTAGTGDFAWNDGGRTATHEVGHWLNLSHIWGDDECGDDLVDDTPTAEGSNEECPTFPHNAFGFCSGSNANGEMYMNYMDYTDDECMNMFSKGQADRMVAALNGPRAFILSSEGCSTPTTSIAEKTNLDLFTISPNPSSGRVSITLDPSLVSNKIAIVLITNQLGAILKEFAYTFDAAPVTLTLETSGIYFITVKSEYSSSTKRLIITTL
jgi:hypothetical protein